ncbi:MAG: hypothetical protein ABSB94_10470 [Syntrophorhabdales bacterium]|jgi:hypothetical protein
MGKALTAEGLISGIRKRAISRDARAPEAIEKYLEEALGDLSLDGKMLLLEEAANRLKKPDERKDTLSGLRSVDSTRIISLLIGREIAVLDLTPEEISTRLAKSLNTIFDTLNQIVITIHSVLLGHRDEEETIRQVIGSEIEGGKRDSSLQGYLDQIQEAFLIAHKGFTAAAQHVIGQILSELDPERIMASVEGGFKFGALRKAEHFNAYREKFRLCNDAFQSGRLTEELLREFEKACQRLYKR